MPWHDTPTVSHAVTSTDTDYSGIDVDDVTVTIDDDEAGARCGRPPLRSWRTPPTPPTT